MKKIVLLLLSLSLLAIPVYAEEKADVIANINGMVCDFCARGLEKVFDKEKRVEKIDVSLEKGTVAIFFEEGKSLSDEEIKKLIENNGYSLEKISRSKSEDEKAS